MSKEKEMRLECACHDPFHFIHFHFDPDPIWEACDLSISLRLYNGGVIKRLIKAFQIIFGGWVESEADWVGFGMDNIRKLRDFCNECLSSSAGEQRSDDEQIL